MGTTRQLRLAVACTLAAMTMAPVQAQVQETVLHNFVPPSGFGPSAGVTLAPDGIYGTFGGGGTAGVGLVYKLDATFHYTVLYNFTGGADGGYPFGTVIRDSAGNLYGTANGGGTLGYGVVYKLAAAGDYSVLHNFSGADGGAPETGLIRDSDGNLYGTAAEGGTLGYGVVYKLDSAGNYTVLYNFTAADGGYPMTGVIRDSAGNFFGTASGASHGVGVVYKLDADGNFTLLHTFKQTDGSYPNGLVLAPDGLYGTAGRGGAGGYGVVYKLDAAANYSVLHNFSGGIDGRQPESSLIRDPAGNLYGTTTAGGTLGHGVIYKLDAAGNFTVLYNFPGGADGAFPQAGVSRSPAGNLAGTTLDGGKYGAGVIYVLTGLH